MSSSDDSHGNEKKRKREEIEEKPVSDDEEKGKDDGGEEETDSFQGFIGDEEINLSGEGLVGNEVGNDLYGSVGEKEGTSNPISVEEIEKMVNIILSDCEEENIGRHSFGDKLLGNDLYGSVGDKEGTSNPLSAEEVDKLVNNVVSDYDEENFGRHSLVGSLLEVKQKLEKMIGILSNVQFHTLNLTSLTKEAIYHMGYYRMTQIQAKCIPALLEGKDVVGAASSASGKTLAFLIPAIELLHSSKFNVNDGTGVIVVCPTTDLALQTHEVARRLLSNSSMTVGIALDGRPRKEETTSVSQSNLLVATPGRLLRHLRRTKGFVYKNLKFLVVDEADRLLEAVFEKEINQIIKLLPKERQTAVFSTTLINKVEDLERLSFQSIPVYINVDEGRSKPHVEVLKQQGFSIVQSEMRFRLLYSFLERNLSKKVMVIFSSCAAVKYYSKLLRYINVDCYNMHGIQKTKIRWSNFSRFRVAEKGVLLCTGDSARGLDIPSVDWVVQYDPSDDPKEYIRRVSKGGKGRALIFLTPQEMPFIKHLLAAEVPLEEYELDEKEFANLLPNLEELVDKESHLRQLAKVAYKSYLLAYKSMNATFNFQLLNLKAVATSFGLSSPPKINLAIC